MKFESYPCNKPNIKVCPELASANGIYLDGTPAESGSYTFVVTAEDPNGVKAAQQFTVTVQAPDRH